MRQSIWKTKIIFDQQMSSILLVVWQPRANKYTNRTKFSKPMKLSILKCWNGKLILACFYTIYTGFACSFCIIFPFFSVLPVLMITSIRHAHSQPASPRSWPSFSQDWGRSTLSKTFTSIPVPALVRLPGVLSSWQSSTLDITVWMRQVSSVFFAAAFPYESLWSVLTGMSSVRWTGWQKVSSFWILPRLGSWGPELCRP